MTQRPRRRYQFRDYLSPKVLVMLALGFSSGLPFNLIGNTLGYWLRDEHTTLTAIGVISWVGITYSLKFLWAPFLDRISMPLLGRLGRRRGWMLSAQIVVGAGLAAMAALGTGHGLGALGVIALVVAFAAATQDTAIDAWRIESASDKGDLGLLTSAYTFGFRTALLGTEAIILPIAQRIGWNASYAVYGVLILIGITACLYAKEPEQADQVMAHKDTQAPLTSARGIFDAIAGPFIAFYRAHGNLAVAMLLAITLYQLGYFVSGPMYNPMYVDVGLTKDMVGTIRGSVGLVGTFLGVATGGYLSLRLGLTPALLIGGVLLNIGTALYAVVPFAHDPATFSAIMFADNFGIAVGGITLVAYMSSLTSLGYTATQYALLSSAYAWAGKLLKGSSGRVVEALAAHYGAMNAYAAFFIGCGFLGVPALVLFALLEHTHRRRARALRVNPA
jgi:PAT family beta-lactamase induction signal transducer AmpG